VRFEVVRDTLKIVGRYKWEDIIKSAPLTHRVNEQRINVVLWYPLVGMLVGLLLFIGYERVSNYMWYEDDGPHPIFLQGDSPSLSVGYKIAGNAGENG